MFRWQVPSAGPTQSVSESLATIRARARHLVRNNPIAASAVEEWVSNLIGSSGITPRWNLDDMKLKSELQALWSRWCEEADADGVYDFTGLQGLVARELIEAGEVFVRIRYRRATDGFSVPLQLQVLESDLVDELYSTVLPSGNVVRCGIELDKIGRRVAYWMFQEHPGEVTPFSSVSIDKKRIPAEQIIHVYRPLRAGQLRGISWLAPVIISLYELDQYEDAELVRKKTAAMFGGFIIEGGEPQLGVPLGADDLGRDIVALEPGTFV
ncbi:MAG: phage portal protein, partial [Nitrososphaerota archaeon]